MKCMPSTLSGRLVAAPSTVIEIDEVFDARMTSGRDDRVEPREQRALCRRVLDDRFDDESASASASRPVATVSRPSAASRSSAVSLPFSTNFARLFSIAARARSSAGADASCEAHGEARLREHLGDAVAHRARADDAESVVDRHGMTPCSQSLPLDRQRDAVAAAQAQRGDAALRASRRFSA